MKDCRNQTLAPESAPGVVPASLERQEPPERIAGATAVPPLDYLIDSEQRLITITGEYADAEAWKFLLSRVLHDPRCEAGFAFLRDLRRATSPVNPSAVARIVDAVLGFWPYLQPSRGAILTTSASEPVALAAHKLADAHDLPVQVFESYDDAVEWLQTGTSRRDPGDAVR